MTIFLSLFLLFSIVFNNYCQDGTLDKSFGNDGRVITTVRFGTNDFGNSIVIQSNGKIVVGGSSQSIETNISNFALVRYNNNGKLDRSFGNNGKVVTPNFQPGSLDEIRNLALDNNGNIVAAGVTGNQVLIARYKPDGTLDQSFGNNGRKLITQLDSLPGLISPDLVIQSDNKIVVVSISTINNLGHFALARLNANGTLDNSFGNNGIVITPSFSSSSIDDIASRIVLQRDGKLVVIGTTFSNSGSNFAIARYNTNGTLDTSFGVAGQVIVPHFSTNSKDIGNSIGIDSNGNIIVSGDSNGVFALAKYLPNGTLNSSFGDSGQVLSPRFPQSRRDFANSMIVQVNNKILVAGYAQTRFFAQFALARYLPDGSLDNSFGNNGQVLTTFTTCSPNDSFGNDLAVQADGKIVVAGTAQGLDCDPKANFALARYNATATPCTPSNNFFINFLFFKYSIF